MARTRTLMSEAIASMILLLIPAVAGAMPPGPLRVSTQNPRYFEDPQGRVVLLAGSHTWENLTDQGPAPPDPPTSFDYTSYLSVFSGLRHNWFRLWVWESALGSPNWDDSVNMTFGQPHIWKRTGPGNGLDGKPRFDLDSLDPAYFDRVRARVIQAGEQGFYVTIQLFQPWSVNRFNGPCCDPWRGHPMNVNNNIQGLNGDVDGDGDGTETQSLSTSSDIPALRAYQEAYVEKLIDTVNDLPNVMYEIANEQALPASESIPWLQHMVDRINAYQAAKPNRHAVGVTTCRGGCDPEIMMIAGVDWVARGDDFINPSVWPDEVSGANGKVSFHDSDHYSRNNATAEVVWRSFLRGHNPGHMDSYLCADQGAFGGCPRPAQATIDDIRGALGVIAQLGSSIDLVHMVPAGDLSSTGYALADTAGPLKDLITWVPADTQVTVDLSSGTGETWDVTWIDAIDDTSSVADPVVGTASVVLTSPFPGRDSAVLVTQLPEVSSPACALASVLILRALRRRNPKCAKSSDEV